MTEREVQKYPVRIIMAGGEHFLPVILVDDIDQPPVDTVVAGGEISTRGTGHLEGRRVVIRAWGGISDRAVLTVGAGIGFGTEAGRLIPLPKTSAEAALTAGFHASGSTVQRISEFSARIDQAALLMSAAFMEANVTDFPGARSSRPLRQTATSAQWYTQVVETCVQRAREVRNALVHRWTPTGRAEHLAADAFMVLSGLSPAANELVRLYEIDRTGAFSQLAKQLEASALQFELSAGLLAEVDAKDNSRSSDAQFSELREALLKRAGGGLSLTEAASLLQVTRQAMHKRVKTGSVLGMMDGSTLVLPHAQFVNRNSKYEVISGLSGLLKLFETAGGWSALQFLVEPDPNLTGKTPLSILAEGRVEDVLSAARAYLDVSGD